MSSVNAAQARHAFFKFPQVDDAVLLVADGDRSTFARGICNAASGVTDNRGDSGRNESAFDATARRNLTRPFADGLIVYNGHAGLGANFFDKPKLDQDPGLA